MQTTIQKWGNSYAVRLPKPLVDRLGLRAGSRVVLKETNRTVMVEKATAANEVGLKDWYKYLIPTGRKRTRNVSEHIDEILYGKPRR